MKKRILTMLILILLVFPACVRSRELIYEPASDSCEEAETEAEEQREETETGTSESVQEAEDEKTAPDVENSDGDSADAETLLYIDISGQVNHPGVYGLAAGSRLFQAVEAAGGYTDRAEIRCVNQAETLFDGEKIYIYSVEETEQLGGWMQLLGTASGMTVRTGGTSTSGSPSGGQAASEGLVNLNLADKAELMTLPGVGEAKADAIIFYRETQGAFSAIEDIMKVTGIKEKLFEKICDKITV